METPRTFITAKLSIRKPESLSVLLTIIIIIIISADKYPGLLHGVSTNNSIIRFHLVRKVKNIFGRTKDEHPKDAIPLHPSCNYVIFTWINRYKLTLSESVAPQAKQVHNCENNPSKVCYLPASKYSNRHCFGSKYACASQPNYKDFLSLKYVV